MKNTYLFIIWNKALFARDKIIKDIEESFEIKMNFFVEWSKDKFEDNLKAFYGNKMDNPKQKMSYIGTGKFNVLLIEDKNPKFEVIDVNGILQEVNTQVLDKKKLYRKWTADCFRIHCSTNEQETKHDLTVLFGNDIPNKNVLLNTKGVEGFNNIEDLNNCLNCFGDNLFVDNRLIISKSSLNISRFLNAKRNKIGLYTSTSKTLNKELIILGQEEGELFNLDYKKIINNKNLINDLNACINDYVNYLNSGCLSEELNFFFDKYSVDKTINIKDTIRYSDKNSFIKELKNKVKYLVAKISI